MIARQTWLAAFSAAAKRVGISASTHDLGNHAASLLIASACPLGSGGVPRPQQRRRDPEHVRPPLAER